MPETSGRAVQIHYEVEGDPSDPLLLLIMGLGAQMTSWTEEFRSELVARGFRVAHFDNRDVGRSTWLDEAGVPDLAGMLAGGGSITGPYLLDDMADDALAVIDELSADAAHVVGISMGGMIAQSLAIAHPERVATLTSIMSTTGAPGVGQPHPEVLPLLLRAPASSRDEALTSGLAAARAISSPGYPFDEERVRTRVAADYDRAWHPDGTVRQLLAIVSSPERTEGLRGLEMPTLVVHGDADPLVDVSGGKATAAAIPGARLWVAPGMGHDLPPALYGPVADAIAEMAAASRASTV